MRQAIRDAVAAATVRFPERGGQGVLVPGGLILTTAHVVDWTDTGAMALGDGEEFVQKIKSAEGRRLLVHPLAVEPVADLAVLGALDDQWHPDAARGFREFREATRPVQLATAELPFDEPVPAQGLAHTVRWISGRARQMCLRACGDSRARSGRADRAGHLRRSGCDGRRLVARRGVHRRRGGGDSSSNIPRPHLAAPVWLVRQMLPAMVAL